MLGLPSALLSALLLSSSAILRSHAFRGTRHFSLVGYDEVTTDSHILQSLSATQIRCGKFALACMEAKTLT